MAPAIIVGLGNPGSEYQGTRHNLGFDVVDELCGRMKLTFRPGKGEYLAAEGDLTDGKFILIKPLTYMNNSGLAVRDAIANYEGTMEGLLVICDDFALPLGRMRVRAGGSDGGHNGLYSIIYALNTDGFARLRCGIGQEAMPPKSAMAQFVLSPFAPEEQATVSEMIKRAAEATTQWITRGIDSTMNTYNTQQ